MIEMNDGEESVGNESSATETTMSIQDVEDIEDLDEQIVALKKIVSRLESDVGGEQKQYQDLTNETKAKKEEISNLEKEIEAEKVRLDERESGTVIADPRAPSDLTRLPAFHLRRWGTLD